MLLLITGASGVAKSTVRAVVEPDLSPWVECVELLDLTPAPSVMSRVWRQQTAETAVRRAVELQASGRHLLLCGDPVPAAELVAAPSATSLDAIAVCLLERRPRCPGRAARGAWDDPALLAHHQAFVEWMRRQASDPLHMTHVVSDGGGEPMRWERLQALSAHWQMHTIDTTNVTTRDVADAVLDWCRRALTGDAPVLQLTGVK